MAVIDRAGMIVSASSSFAQLVGVPFDAVCDGKRFIVEFVEEADFMSFVEIACNLALSSRLKSSFLSCKLLYGGFPGDKSIHCSISLTMRRDSRSVPVYAAATFIPTSPISGEKYF